MLNDRNLRVYRDGLDEILNLIESVSEGFHTYSCISELLCLCCVEILKSLPVHSFNALMGLFYPNIVHLAVACDVYHGVSLCCPFSNEMSWMRS